jgi:lysine 6-dehydrogenase
VRYGVIGAGRQGTAAAYDMAARGGADEVLLADRDPEVARQAAERIDRLVGRRVASFAQIDVVDEDELARLIRPLDAVLCATPYAFIPVCTKAAITAGTGMVDLGGHTPTVLGQLRLDDAARSARVAIVPDCGMGPGLNNSMALGAIESLEIRGVTPREARVWDGGLPQRPTDPFGYQLFFHVEGLTNEYDGTALVLREGQVREIETLTEYELLEFDELGTLEAFVTSGGASTVPYTMEGSLDAYENKTLRYPGHFAAFRAFKDLGLFSKQPVEVDGASVTPRDFYHRLLTPRLDGGSVRDICVMRAEAVGVRDGERTAIRFELVDHYDEPTGFAAMERLTGWHAAIITEMIARREIADGVHPLERALPQLRVIEEIEKRGLHVRRS